MDYKAFFEFCEEKKIEYKQNEAMKFHTSFKIGGEADVFISVKTVEELKFVLVKAKSLGIPFFILGKGSNLLVSDNGIEGLVISLLKMDEVLCDGDEITAFAGASLANVCNKAYENSLEGLEFAYGIPGSIGGALYMNAGAYGGEMCQVVKSAEYITLNGEIGRIDAKDMALGYRTSIFKTGDMVITSVTLKLQKGDKTEIKSKMDDFIGRRIAKQPLEFPSAGSTFKRPTGYFAGALIEENGLKGRSVGGAQVSEKHAGFIINTGDATCMDVRNLILEIQNIIKEKNGVKLETEVIFVGRE